MTEKRFRSLLNPYFKEIESSYRIGHTNISEEAKAQLRNALRLGYIYGIRQVIGADIREEKQNDNLIKEILSEMSRQLDNNINVRTQQQEQYITDTSNKWMFSITAIALNEGYSQKEADALLRQRLRNQKITIAVTESQWVVETARKTAVVSIPDPLKNSVEEMARLISIGEYTAAKKIMKEIRRVVGIAISKNQEELIRLISNSQEKLVNPLSQARVLANIREKAEKLGTETKTWQIFGVRTRESHREVNGQVRKIDEPFSLAGGLLQYPGDGSLGARLKEIINCNCVAAYS